MNPGFSAAAACLLVGVAMNWAADPPLIVAHRGASLDAPENTLAAFREAWRQGADAIEGDFRLTSDGRLICLHDEDLKRIAGDPRKVDELTFDQIRSLEIGRWKGGRFRNERAPSLVEVLGTAPNGGRVFVELKEGPEIIGPLKQELAAMDVDPVQVVVIAFDSDTIAECKKQLPRLRCHWLTSLKKQRGHWSPTPVEVRDTLRQCGADGVGFKGVRDALTREYLQSAGVREFHVWTVDDPSDAAYFRGLGTLGITTNRPGWLREKLNVARLSKP